MSMFDIKEKPKLVERAFLIGAYFDRRNAEDAADLLNELKELVETLGITVVATECIFVRDFNPRYMTGSGKAAELIEQAKQANCDCIIFDNELTPAQQRAWDADANLLVIDRHEVILDIFNMRAQTREARLQVELARMEYSLPRLARMWGHLDRQGASGGSSGGSGGAARGVGESQLEIDRRLAHKRIEKVKAELEEVSRTRDTMRKERSRQATPHVAIVGYTNAGKSSLLNALTGAQVLAEDKLFATLDTTTRKLELPDGQDILVTDTVGFVRALPHDLVQSFRATLEETLSADILVHVIDASDRRHEQFHRTTTEVLAELGAGEKRTLLVLNKIDLVTESDDLAALQVKFPEAVRVSTVTRQGIEELQHKLHEMLLDRVCRLTLLLPMSRMDLVNVAHKEGKVLKEKYTEHGVELQVVLPKAWESRFTPFVASPSHDEDS